MAWKDKRTWRDYVDCESVVVPNIAAQLDALQELQPIECKLREMPAEETRRFLLYWLHQGVIKSLISRDEKHDYFRHLDKAIRPSLRPATKVVPA